MAEERLAVPQPCWKLHFAQPRLLLQSEEIRCWPQDARVAAGQVTKRTADPDRPARENSRNLGEMSRPVSHHVLGGLTDPSGPTRFSELWTFTIDFVCVTFSLRYGFHSFTLFVSPPLSRFRRYWALDPQHSWYDAL